MVTAGVVGAGFVWGWFLVLLVARPAAGKRSLPAESAQEGASKLVRWFSAFLLKWQTERRPYLNLIAVAIFTSWFAWLVYTLTSATLLIPFFIALITAFSIHFAWLQQLRRAKNSS